MVKKIDSFVSRSLEFHSNFIGCSNRYQSVFYIFRRTCKLQEIGFNPFALFNEMQICIQNKIRYASDVSAVPVRMDISISMIQRKSLKQSRTIHRARYSVCSSANTDRAITMTMLQRTAKEMTNNHRQQQLWEGSTTNVFQYLSHTHRHRVVKTMAATIKGPRHDLSSCKLLKFYFF